MTAQIDQVRVVEIPNDDDEILDLSNPIRADKIIAIAYLGLLDRFTDELSKRYLFARVEDPISNDDYFQIRPRHNQVKEENFYNALIHADNQHHIREIHLSLDTAHIFKKSFMGVHVKMTDYKAVIHLRNVNGFNYFYYGKLTVSMDIEFRQKVHPVTFVSELVNLNIKKATKDGNGHKKNRKISSLFNYRNRYTDAFWENPEIPSMTAEDTSLLADLKDFQSKFTSH
jgi:hypothetical protein